MMILKEYEVCSLSMHCKYNSSDGCGGAKSGRDNEFICDYVKDGKILDGHSMRIPGDKTGRMKIILE
jgi:hypothetical protein